MGLPPSAGNTTVLTIVDRLSKAARFIALSKLPSALATARLLTTHVFRLLGIPEDIVFDRGPQFTSRVWKEFCTTLGAKVCLSSGCHCRAWRATRAGLLWTKERNEAVHSLCVCLSGVQKTLYGTKDSIELDFKLRMSIQPFDSCYSSS